MKYEAGDYIRFAYNMIGLNFDDSDADKYQRTEIAIANLEKCKNEMLNQTVSDCFLKRQKLTRVNETTTNPNSKSPYSNFLNNKDIWYGYSIPHDFIRIINSSSDVIRIGNVIYSPNETMLEITYIRDIPYNEIDGNAQSLLINKLASTLANIYNLRDTNLLSILDKNLETSIANVKFDNNEKCFADIIPEELERW